MRQNDDLNDSGDDAHHALPRITNSPCHEPWAMSIEIESESGDELDDPEQ